MGAKRQITVSREGKHGYVIAKCDEYGELCDSHFFPTRKEADDFLKADFEREVKRHGREVKGKRLYQDGEMRPIIYLEDEFNELMPIQWLVTRVAVPKAA